MKVKFVIFLFFAVYISAFAQDMTEFFSEIEKAVKFSVPDNSLIFFKRFNESALIDKYGKFYCNVLPNYSNPDETEDKIELTINKMITTLRKCNDFYVYYYGVQGGVVDVFVAVTDAKDLETLNKKIEKIRAKK
ncbi:MAG: hypothetical protein Ta2D_08620 [Rickettsiales bacterium]|nr:MAG: hypothetical protein Ta2D_08620 [Rickettsiales bacterium]